MPFRQKGSLYYKTHVSLPDGRDSIFACGTDDLTTALAVERMVKTLKSRRQFRGLELVLEKRITLPALFDAYESGRLSDLISEKSQADLAEHLREWDGNPKYKTQVGVFLGDAFPASQFTRKAISEFLSGLKVSGSTRNRYRAALSVFAGWLVEREIIPHNPVRDVKASKPNPARLVWLEREQAKTLIAALPLPYRALEALMACTGMEWQAIERLRRRDIDLKARTVHARGGKTAWRNRVVRPTEEWAWQVFAKYVKPMTGNTLVFPVSKFTALDVHKRIAKDLGLPFTTLHDWRHTYSVQALRDGYSLQVVAHQLGHHNTTLVQQRYGRFVPDERDYRRHAASSETAAFHSVGREALRSSKRSTAARG